MFVDNKAQMKLALWNDASTDATGLYSRSQKLAGTVEKVITGSFTVGLCSAGYLLVQHCFIFII